VSLKFSGMDVFRVFLGGLVAPPPYRKEDLNLESVISDEIIIITVIMALASTIVGTPGLVNKNPY